MPQTLPPETAGREGQGRNELLATLIRKNVLGALGVPPDLLRVQVGRLWECHFRVNVFVGVAAAARVAHSYFLKAGVDGSIVSSTPKITRQY